MNAPAVIHANDIVPFSDMMKMADAVAKSGLFGMKTADQALALMLTAQAEGQHPATITQDYDIIQGRAARKTNSVLARFQQAGGSVEWHCLTNAKADATFTPPPSAGKPVRMDWTIEQATKIGLTGKDNWQKYPRAMLRARCIAEGIRAVFPAAIGGMLLAEEAQDLDAQPEKTVGSGTVAMPQSKSAATALAQTGTVIDGETGEIIPQSAPAASASAPPPTANAGGAASDTKPSGGDMTPGQGRMIYAKLKAANLTMVDLQAQYPGKCIDLEKAGAGETLFQKSEINDVIKWIESKAA